MTKVSSKLGMRESINSYRESDAWVLPRCLIGVEFEFENARRRLDPANPLTGQLTEHEERSLHDHGVEYVFAEPMFGEDAASLITYMLTQARILNYRCTERTGIHVHVNVKDLTVDQLERMLMLYALYEKAIYRWVGDGREDNVFCLPWYAVDKTVDLIAELIKDEDSFSVGMADRINRYAGLNLNALAKFGSVEFRHLRTTLDTARVNTWINMALTLKKAAMDMTLTSEEILSAVSLDSVGFARRVWGPYFYQLYYADMQQDIWEYGVPVCHDLCFMKRRHLQGNPFVRTLTPGDNPVLLSMKKKAKPAKKAARIPDTVLLDPLGEQITADMIRRTVRFNAANHAYIVEDGNEENT